MIRLKKILEDIQTEETAYIIDGDKRAFVGVEHGKTPKLPKTGIEKIKSIGDKWGYWYEGKPANAALKGTDGKVSVSPGEVRHGGSYTQRLSNIAVWNTVMPNYDYSLDRWHEFLIA